VVVIGNQSAGKSSVLEAIVGSDILPKVLLARTMNLFYFIFIFLYHSSGVIFSLLVLLVSL
jgi:hypothetical protein